VYTMKTPITEQEPMQIYRTGSTLQHCIAYPGDKNDYSYE